LLRTTGTVTLYRCITQNETAIVPFCEGDIIPIYEYACQACGHRFELLVRGTSSSTRPSCPECESAEVERTISTPAVKSSGTHELAMRAAKKRDAAQGKERMHAQREYELNHD